jgi:hypothetical protein
VQSAHKILGEGYLNKCPFYYKQFRVKQYAVMFLPRQSLAVLFICEHSLIVAVIPVKVRIFPVSSVKKNLKAMIFHTGGLNVKPVSLICKMLLQTTASYSGSRKILQRQTLSWDCPFNADAETCVFVDLQIPKRQKQLILIVKHRNHKDWFAL